MSAQVTEAHLLLAEQLIQDTKLSSIAQLIADSEAKAVAGVNASLDAAIIRAWGISAERDQLRTERNNLRADLDAIKAIRDEETARAERAEAELHALRLVCGTTDANKFSTWVDRANAKAEKAEAELAKAKAVLASIEEDGTEEHNAAVRLRQELAAERARLRQLALDACRAAAIVPVVWYPTGYYVNPNDLGKINKQQVDACVAAIDAAMKEGK